MIGRRHARDVKGRQRQGLADLIIGKEVKDAGPAALRHVRRAERDQIYTSRVKTDKFSTKFEDWIEKDLLKLNAFDIRQVALNDYSTSRQPTADGVSLRVKNAQQVELGFDDAKSSWNLIEMDRVRREGRAGCGQAGRGRRAE